MQETVLSRIGVDRVLKFAFELARKTPKKHLTSATKSNGIAITMPYWDERFEAMAENYPDIKWNKYHIDILTAQFVLKPDRFDVVVASNLFGDILSDLGPACTGTIGIAPSGNINPERKFPSLFEPVHGSAPDIAGQGIANPIGQIWSGAMMLEHLGETEAAAAIVKAIEKVLAERQAAHPRSRRAGEHRRLAARRWPPRSRNRESGIRRQVSGIRYEASGPNPDPRPPTPDRRRYFGMLTKSGTQVADAEPSRFQQDMHFSP